MGHIGAIKKEAAATVAALSDLNNGNSDIRSRLYDGQHVALTQYNMRDGMWLQVTAKDPLLQRSGHGYLLLNADAARELYASLAAVFAAGHLKPPSKE